MFQKVKYVGKNDSYVVEYNGKKYSFTKKENVLYIPLEVYQYIQRTETMHSGDIIPFQDDKPALQEETKKNISNEIAEIEKEIEEEEEKREVKEIKKRNTRMGKANES